MIKKYGFLLGFLFAIVAPVSALAATLSLSVVVNSMPSTSITCPVSATLTVPLAPGTVLCTLTVQPSNWSGTLALSGTNAGLLAISSGTSGTQLVVGANPITVPGTYAATITSTP